MHRKSQDISLIAVTAEINLKKYATIFGVLFCVGILLEVVPFLFKAMVIKKIGLKPGSEIRDFYTKASVPNDFKIYLFNVTNKDEVTKGAKPRVQEIGPYVFEEWKEKFDATDNEETDTLTFNMKSTFIFRPDLSKKGLTGNEIISTVHPLITGIALNVNANRKPMLRLASKAINQIFHNPKEPFWTGRVMDYLFDGFEIDCTADQFEAQAVCSILGDGDVKSIEPLRENFYKFSVFGAMNGSGIGMYEVYRGVNNLRDVGRVVSFDNKTEMEQWDGEECNEYKGTDSTIFPPGLTKEDTLWAYEPNVCMSIGANYERDSNYLGIPTIRFGLDFGDARKNEKLHCYCYDPPTDCPRQGTMNLFQCVDVPIVLSLPHFYKADPSLLTQIESGLIPNESEHAFYIDYEAITGSQVNAAKRLQFNLDIVPITEVECMKNLPVVVMPLFWVEEGASLNETFEFNILKYQLLLLVKIIQWIAIISGAAGTMFSVYMYFKVRNTTTLAHIQKMEEQMINKVTVREKLDPIQLMNES